MKRRAFTLVELLVVIAIVGLLSTIAIVSLSSSRAKARNAKRIADIKQLVMAFNLGLNIGSSGSYPSTGGNVFVCVSASCYSGWSSYATNAGVDAFISPYMPVKPADPSGDSRGFGGYMYNGAWPGTGSFTAGVILDYTLEPTTDCGPGKPVDQRAAYTECIVYLN